MVNQNKSLSFSVVIPTRDRPELFKLALDSVLSQDYDNVDVHVVNDGSSGDYVEQYKKLEEQYNGKVTFHYLTYRPNGHGQSYSMNYGAYFSKGDYLCFLDDDDYWIDNHHLSRAANSIAQANNRVDLYYTNQKAYFSDGRQKEGTVWIEDVETMLNGKSKDSQNSCQVDVPTLLKSAGFAHLNCSIYLRELYNTINGMDEHIRYECDRDIYIRSLDAAEHILYNPVFISKHHIPDPKQSTNMSTMISIYEKKLFQLRVYDKGILFSNRPELVDFCMLGKAYELKHIAEALANEKQYNKALYYARKALGAAPTSKWMLYTLMLYLKSKLN